MLEPISDQSDGGSYCPVATGQRHRGRAEFKQTNKHDVSSWYGSQIDKLLLEINAVFREAAGGQLWNTISSYMANLKAKELIGLAKSLNARSVIF